MKNYSVILLESNTAVLEQLKNALDASEDFEVTYAGDDGEEGFSAIVKYRPDLVFVSTFIKGTDGIEIISKLKKHYPEMVIVASGVANDSIIEQTIFNGASYYFIKPFSVRLALERFKDLLRNKTEARVDVITKKKRPATLEERISEIFISIGIPPHVKGYAYLREAIKIAVDRPYVINAVTKELYPSVALKFGTTASKVERAIRHAIEVAWNRGRIDAINAIFGARIYLGTEKPTNSEFIALVADKLMLENLES